MTITSPPRTVQAVTMDLYRDIHKGIRTELFSVTTEAARIDPASRDARAVLAGRVDGLVNLLVSHAEHEDGGIAPAMQANLPDLAAQVEADHVTLESRMDGLRAWAAACVDAGGAIARHEVHGLYLELASFSAAYLLHQDLEERVVMPALEAAIGVEAVLAIHGAIIGSIPPPELAASLAIMLPAMNVDDRTELLGGMRAGAPAEVFEGIWGLAGTVLSPADREALATRLDLA